MARRLPLRTAVLLAIAAGAVAQPHASVAETYAPAQHLTASARAGVLRWDPRLAGNYQDVNLLGASSARVSTVGLDGEGATTVARAASATHESRTRYTPGPASAEQKAGAADNAAPTSSALPSGAASSAHARAIDLTAGECPPADARGVRTIASATAAMAAALSGLPLEADESASSTSEITLEPVDGSDALAVRSVASTSIARVRVLDAYEIRVLSAPTLEARATGLAGGASFAYTAPVVEIVDLSTNATVARLDAANDTVDLTPDNATIAAGFPAWVMFRLGVPHSQIVMKDGTYARAQADLVEVRFPEGFEWGHLRVAPLAVSVGAPRGGVVTCDGEAAPVLDRTVPRILVYERAGGWEHTSIQQASRAMAEIANSTGAFTLEFADDPSFVRADKLAGVDAIHLNSTTGTFPNTAQRPALLKWVGCGGGTIGSHAASDLNHGWAEWKELIGAEFEGHPHVGYFPVVGEATVVVEDQTSPITEAWHGKESFRWAEEYYSFTDDPRGKQDIHVLLSLDETTTYPYHQVSPTPFLGPYMERQPLAWTKTFRGTGRVFYTAFGHNGFSWQYPEFRTHMLRGAEWVTAKQPDVACVLG